MGFLVDWCLDSWDNMPGGKISRAVLSVVLLVLIISLPLGVYWSITPNSFELVDEAKLDAETRGIKVTTGYSSVYTLHRVVDTLLHKPGGYITNDKLPPGLWFGQYR